MRKTSLIIALAASASAIAAAPAAAKETLLFNRIGPTKSELYVANADGSGEHKLLSASDFDYAARYSQDGQWIVFTSERTGRGQSDIYRVKADGTALERLTDDPGVDDQASLSPDNRYVAFMSDRGASHRANIWVLDLKTRKLTNLTGAAAIQGDPAKPDGFYRPAWSPDGQWIAFTSDRNTEWKSHDKGAAWEHLQELAVYVVRPDGTGLKRLTAEGVTTGSPKWSADGKSIIAYQGETEVSWLSRVDQLSMKATTQIVSVDVATGKTTELTSGAGVKLYPQFLPGGRFAYSTKSAQISGIMYSDGAKPFPANLREPAWSADGSKVIYERIDNSPLPQNAPLYSWKPQVDYRYTDVFPMFAKDGTLALSNKDVDTSLVTMNADGTGKQLVFQSTTHCAAGKNASGHCGDMIGVALFPSWMPDSKRMVFSFGGYWRTRDQNVANVKMINRDGTGVEDLTSTTSNTGFASISPDGKQMVYRSWAKGDEGLRIMDLETRKVRVLTNGWDNVPGWSPAADLIVFTRKQQDGNFDIFTIRSDGTDEKRVTTFPASDAHAVWSWDGKKILWNSSEYGFKDEAALYDNSFQPYGQVWSMNPDGTDKEMLTDSRWEDSMPAFAPTNLPANIAKN
ncbi:PD40 domain-containing protein [Novosphingobium flavum]|uniref:PD40 domain-containing protein n=1 Tax=Novosphingobium flavum TaxID=1778672 RepID=A0A7X1FVP7_9SPHN|nr:PD40 domain-containing protein [Novosphingobium flavum]MBC2667262.1 PD40 domain-containing protein [Novosphingobium flavum]